MNGERSYITLLELNQMVRQAIDEHLAPAYWVVGEVSEFNEARSGHCYLELIEKGSINDQPVAKSRAAIWATTYRMLKPYFEKATGQALGAGMKILVKVSVRYHEVYGLSLTVSDIEPAFTLGDLEKKRQETILRLKEEGIFELNSQLTLDPLPRFIAIISSPTAAGYGDFVHQLDNNEFGFRFHTVLFPAYMQGSDAVESIIAAMEKVYRHVHLFQALVIIRGGGSRSELACFDSYELASHICQFPLPVLAGIGHERDFSVADMVAHTRLKTPTATAQFLVDHLYTSMQKAEETAESIFGYATDMLSDARHQHHQLALTIQSLSVQFTRMAGLRQQHLRSSLLQTVRYLTNRNARAVRTAQDRLQQISGKRIATATSFTATLALRLKPGTERILLQAKQREEMIRRFTEAHHPKRILKKGFSVTVCNGQTLISKQAVKPGDRIETRLHDGSIISHVEEIKDNI